MPAGDELAGRSFEGFRLRRHGFERAYQPVQSRADLAAFAKGGAALDEQTDGEFLGLALGGAGDRDELNRLIAFDLAADLLRLAGFPG